jgi:hypothetical protein
VVPAGNATKQLPPRGPVPERPAVCIAPTDQPPTIDGQLDDTCWTSAVTIRQFNLSYESRYAPYETRAFLTYDQHNLYVGFRIDDPDTGLYPWLPYPPDRDPNVAEVLIAAPKEETYYKVAISGEGKIYVEQPMGNTVPWKVAPNAAIQRDGTGWSAEFSLPLVGTEMPAPWPTGVWRMNFGWRTKKCTDYTAWAVTHAWFYETQFFGDVYFGGPTGLSAQVKSVSAPNVDVNDVPVEMVNRGENAVPCEVMVTVDAGDPAGAHVAFFETVEVFPREKKLVQACYRLADGMTGVATITVREAGSVAPILCHSIPIEVAPNRRAFRETEMLLATLPDELSAHSESERASIRGALDALRELVRTDGAPPNEWNGSALPLKRLSARARKLLWQVDHKEELADATFAVGCIHSLSKVFRDRAYDGPVARVVNLSAARNEYEGFHLLAIPLDIGLDNLNVEASALAGPSGAEIPAGNVEVFWEDFVESRTPRYPIDYVGWIGDPLIPRGDAPPHVSANALHQPLWITVFVPEGVPSGIYTGTITVQASGAEWPVTLRVRVYDFDLPVRPALRTSMWLNPQRIKDWYHWDEIPPEVQREQMDFLLRHRINPTWFGPVGSDEDIDWQIERGLNLVMLGIAAEWPLPEDMQTQIDRYYRFFKERDLLDMVFIYGQDEPSPQHYPKVRDTLTKVAEQYPGVRRVCTAYPPVPELEGAVDTWVVGPNLFNYGPVAERIAAGDELWFYESASVRRPYASQLYLDYTALEHRLIGWFCWKYGATGFLYWGINEWESNNQPWSGRSEIDDAIRTGKRWPEVPWNTWTYLNCNGDAQYIYPGKDGAFWSSVRMEILRDTFEDYDYLALLRDARDELKAANLPDAGILLADANELLEIGPPLASDLTVATDDPNVLLERRNAIAEHIERIREKLRTR